MMTPMRLPGRSAGRAHDEIGQAVIEFVFVLMLMGAILSFVFMMFHFSEDTFFAIVAKRAELLEDYHKADQWDEEMRRSTKEIRAQLRDFPLVSAILEGNVAPLVREFGTLRGTKTPMFENGWGARIAECGGTSLPIALATTTSNMGGNWWGSAAGAGLCLALWEY